MALKISTLIYAGFIACWFLARSVLGDSIALTALLNTFALYLFLPLFFLAVASLALQRLKLLLVLALPALLFILLYGEMFVPKFTVPSNTAPSFKLLTWNVNGGTPNAEPVIAKIKREAPDLVLLQEVNPFHAQGITDQLARDYPYQWLEPMWDWRGMGIVSRIPFRDHGWIQLGDDPFAARWIELDWNGASLYILDVHLAVTYPGRDIAASFRQRELQVHELERFIDQHPQPVLIAGDLNLTDTTRAYALLRQNTRDAFRDAGWGLGMTFPAEPSFVRRMLAAPFAKNEEDLIPLSESAFFQLVPALPLTRIDYIFYTRALIARQAFTASWDGQSDHSTVVATFQLNDR